MNAQKLGTVSNGLWKHVINLVSSFLRLRGKLSKRQKRALDSSLHSLVWFQFLKYILTCVISHEKHFFFKCITIFGNF